jgi:hypothetical protein
MFLLFQCLIGTPVVFSRELIEGKGKEKEGKKNLPYCPSSIFAGRINRFSSSLERTWNNVEV